ncbi:MAG TPA: sorbosone dehydrogenase family protein [Terriglobia bacterium]|nr:sorbosone dehydrogenase family protein [Terriglobia bacterium]
MLSIKPEKIPFVRGQQGERMRIAKVQVLFLTCLTAVPFAFSQVTHGRVPVLPRPFIKPIEANPPEVNPVAGFKPRAPEGFSVSLFARGFKEPRYLTVAPDGDVFVADSTLGEVIVLHDPGRGAASNGRTVFADGLAQPFGIAFHGNYVYVADTNEVLRFRYDPKTSRRLGKREHILGLPGGGMHWTRTVVFSQDGKKMYVAAGSDCNVCVEPDSRRAAITAADPDGRNASIYASGLRNAVGLAINPETGELWADVNERDMMGDDLPPDYFTHVTPGGFYGWPYSYIGQHLDPRVKTSRPDLVAKAIIPDVLLKPHVAPLECVFYRGDQFPEPFRHGAFIAEHGSWNRSILSGYEVVFIPFRAGRPGGDPAVFLTGFDPDPHSRVVNGRPAGVAEAKDGSLLVSDDGGNVIWRVSKKP